jgi:transposase-like protein
MQDATVSTTSPTSCPACSAPYRRITWNGGSPPYGPDHWLCESCGHEWSTPPAASLPAVQR